MKKRYEIRVNLDGGAQTEDHADSLKAAKRKAEGLAKAWNRKTMVIDHAQFDNDGIRGKLVYRGGMPKVDA